MPSELHRRVQLRRAFMSLPSRDGRGLQRDNHVASPATAQPSLSAVLPSSCSHCEAEHLGCCAQGSTSPRRRAEAAKEWSHAPKGFSHLCRFPEQSSESWAMRKATLPHTWPQAAQNRAPAESGEENFHLASLQQTPHHGTAAPCRYFPPFARGSPVLAAPSWQLACPHSSRRARPVLPLPRLASSLHPCAPVGCHRRLLPPRSGRGKAPSQPGQGRAEGSSMGGR